MNCTKCGVEVRKSLIEASGDGPQGFHWVPVNILLWHDNYKVPFYCEECGAIKSPWKPLRDIALIYPIPVKDTYAMGGQVVIPDNYKQFYRKGEGVLLAVGPGYYDTKKFCPTNPQLTTGSFVRYNPEVPWSLPVIATDDKEHILIICGAQDIWWTEN